MSNSHKLSNILKKGSKVRVIAGKFKNKTGIVISVHGLKVFIDSITTTAIIQDRESKKSYIGQKKTPVHLSNLTCI